MLIDKFPDVWGAIDCTHVVVKPKQEVATLFYDRKGNTSLNVQAVVGPEMRILHFVNRHPGSAHDSRIFRNSSLYALLESQPPAGHLLGDAGYACAPYLLTPFRVRGNNVSSLTPAQQRYQKSHARTRNVIERFFGAWKSKFQCLKGMRLSLQNSVYVVNACAFLWNFLIDEKEPLLPEEEAGRDEYVEESNAGDSSHSTGRRRSPGDAKREELVRTHFSLLI